MKKTVIILSFALLMLFAACAREARQETQAVSVPAHDTVKPVRVSPENTDAAEPVIAPAPDGSVYVAWVEHRSNKDSDVMLAHLDSEGRATAQPSRVNPQAGEATAWRGDPPTLALSPDGTIYVGWTRRVETQGHASDLYLSVSRDRGVSFAEPVKVNDDQEKVTHGMHSLAAGANNQVYVVWLDERNVVQHSPAANQKGMKMEHMEANREVFFAASTDGGRTFSRNLRLAKEACPCCKTAVTLGADGRVYASWRQVLPGEFRHIAVAASEDNGRKFSAPVIVSDDRWITASCPVSGPALSSTDEGRLRVVWYTEGDRGAPGLYWAESLDQGKTFSESKPFMKGQARGNPRVVMNERMGATIVWESDEGGAARVMSAPLAGDGSTSTASLTTTGELPSAAVSGDQLFVSYIAKANDQRSIWIVRAKPIT